MLGLNIKNIYVFERIKSGEQGFVVARDGKQAIKKLKQVYPDIEESIEMEDTTLYSAEDGEKYGDVYITRIGIG